MSLTLGFGTILTGALSRNPLPVGWAIFLPLILSTIAVLIEEHANRKPSPVKPWEFPVVSYSEPSHPEKPKKRI